VKVGKKSAKVITLAKLDVENKRDRKV